MGHPRNGNARGQAGEDANQILRHIHGSAHGAAAPDQRVLRLVRDIPDLIVFDREGGEPLWSYSDAEISEALAILRRSTPQQRRALALQAMVGDGGLVPAADVLEFPR